MCSKEIGLFAHNMLTIIGSITNVKGGGICMTMYLATNKNISSTYNPTVPCHNHKQFMEGGKIPTLVDNKPNGACLRDWQYIYSILPLSILLSIMNTAIRETFVGITPNDHPKLTPGFRSQCVYFFIFAGGGGGYQGRELTFLELVV